MAACRERGGTPLRQPGFETVRDLNGDGRPDYLIDFRALRCRQPGGGATTGGDRCGEAGDCALHVYVSVPAGGHARTNAFMARGWSLPAGAPATLLVQEGDCADEACARRHVWDGAAFAGPAPQNGR